MWGSNTNRWLHIMQIIILLHFFIISSFLKEFLFLLVK